MSTLTKKRVRIKLDQDLGIPFSISNVLTGDSAETWQANATDIEIAVFNTDAIASVSDLTSINCKIQPSQIKELILADSTVASGSLDDTTTAATWTDGTQQHALFSFTNAEMNLTVPGSVQEFWLVFTGLTTAGSEVTLGAGKFFIHQDNNVAGDPPATNLGTAITIEEADARYATIGGAAGDMLAATYDPATVAGDAFDMINMVESSGNLILKTAERTTIGTVAPHIADTTNPHSVTKAQVGLGNVDDTADAAKPVSTAQQTALDLKADAADVDTSMLYEQYFTGQSGLSSIRAMLDADKSCGMVVIGDSTGDNPTTAWPRKFADIIATNYAGHRVVLQDVTQDATKAYVETVVQAGSNGDRYMEWRPETPTAWATSTSYSVADWVGATHPSSAYICTVAHTAGGDDEEPGVGANWENYWEVSTNCSGALWPSEDVDFFHGDNSTESTESFEILLDLYIPSGMSVAETAFAKFTATAIERGARIDIHQTGVPLLLWQADKTLSTLTTESPPSGGANRTLPFDTRCLLRVRFDPDNGASNRTIDFHYSTDSGASWTQMGGATETGAVTKWAKTPGFITLGASGGSSTSGFWGLKVYQLTIREGIAGTGRVLGNPLIDTASWAINISNPILRGDPVFEIQNFSWSGKNTEDMAGNVALTGSTFIESSDFTPSNVVSAMINLGHNDNPNALSYFAGKNWTVGLKVISDFIQAQCPFAAVGVIGQNPKNNDSEYDKQHALRIAYGLSEVPKNGDGFCNIYQAFLDFNKLALVTDGTHPNEEGYEFWAATLWQAAQIGH